MSAGSSTAVRQGGEKAPAAAGAPLVATWRRGVVAAAIALGIVAVGGHAYERASHGQAPRALVAAVAGALGAAAAALLWALLRAEELRLSRELRTARTGTAALRAMVASRRREGSTLARFVSTRLGSAALLLADADRSGALAALAGGSPLMRGGRLDTLRAVVEADADRATGSPAALDRSIERLLAMAPVGHREADRYRTHVLVKAVLERGDIERGLELAARLSASADEEERVYRFWLETWFESDSAFAESAARWPAASEGELRKAALLARTHGAERLVERLEARAAAIAPPPA